MWGQIKYVIFCLIFRSILFLGNTLATPVCEDRCSSFLEIINVNIYTKD